MMSWTITLSMQQMSPASRLSQQSNLYTCSRESPNTIFCPTLPAATGLRHRQLRGFVRQKSLPLLCWGSEPALQVIDAGGAGTVILVPEFTSSQPLPAWSSPFSSLTSTGVACTSLVELEVQALVVQWLEMTLCPSPFCYPWCCVVCWPPPTGQLLILQTLYQCTPPASAETIACGPTSHCSPWLRNYTLPWELMLG